MTLANRTGSEPVEKSEFNEVLRSRLSERIVTEMLGLADALGESVRSVVYGDEDPKSAIERNLNQFQSAATAAVDRWASEAKDAAGRVAKVPPKDALRGMALDAYTSIVASKPVNKRSDHRRLMTTTPITKSAAYADAERQAARAFPDETNPQVRMFKFFQTPAGKEAHAAYIEATPDRAPAPESAPVLKGQNAVDRATAEARQLMKAHPDRFPSEAAARAHVWRTNPDLSEQYQREAYA